MQKMWSVANVIPYNSLSLGIFVAYQRSLTNFHSHLLWLILSHEAYCWQNFNLIQSLNRTFHASDEWVNHKTANKYFQYFISLQLSKLCIEKPQISIKPFQV